MKKLFIFACAAVMALSSCGTGHSIKNDVDTVSYAYGVNIATSLLQREEFKDLNPNLLAKGIIDVYREQAKMDGDSSIVILNEYFNVKLPAKKLKAQETYLESVRANNPNAQVTESGLIYEVVMPGDVDVKATDSRDVVKVNYTGRLREGDKYDPAKEGTVFDSNEGIEFPLNRVIPGWTEGMKLVGKGGKIRLWIPSELAYGPYGQGQLIGPNEPLFFEVDLVDVTPAETEEAAN